jgi:hypothetical protein
MGGPADCSAVLSGNTAEELVTRGMDHVTQTHPELAEQIKKMTPEETAKWMAEFQTKFDAAPDAA